MRCLIASLTLLLVVAPVARAAEWKEVRCEEGNFAIRLPGAAKDTTKRHDTKYGPVTEHEVRASDGNIHYLAAYAVFPKQLSDVMTPQIMDITLNESVRQLPVLSQTRSTISLGGYQGRESVATFDDKGVTAYHVTRVYLVDNTMLNVGIASRTPINETDKQRFFGSLKALR